MTSFYDVNIAPFIPYGYEISKYLTTESDAILLEVKCLTDKNYEILKVLNILKLDNDKVEKYISIINRVQDLECDNIIKYTLITSNDNYLGVVMKDYPYSLQNINPHSFFENSGIYELLMEITSAIKVLHSNNIIHSNIKPSNILITKGEHFILTDYYKNILNNPSTESSIISINSIHYLSPETIQSGEITTASDMWSIGGIIYYLYKSYSPFEGKTIFQIMKNISICNYKPLPKNKKGYELINKILENLLNIKKEKRYTIDQLIELLSKYEREEFIFINNEEEKENENERSDGNNEDKNDIEIDEKTIEIINKRIDIYKNNLSNGLIFSFDHISDNGIRYLSHQLETMENLTKLILRDNNITDNGLKVISFHLKYIQQLSILNLSSNLITEKGLEVFCRKLKNITSLKKLDLSYNSINDNGVEYLISSIYKCPQLEDLNILNNRINDIDTAKENILSSHPNRSLNLSI